MKNRRLWKALCAAVLCVALLCGAFAVSAEELTDIELDLGSDAIGTGANEFVLDLDPEIGASLEEIPGIDLDGPSFGLDGTLIPEELDDSAVSAVTLANDESTDTGTASEAEKVQLKVAYTGQTLTKVYDTTRNVFKKTESGGYAYAITVPNASDFSLEPVEGSAWVEGHTDVQINIGKIVKVDELFAEADVGSYTLKITFGLKGVDADYYTAQTAELPAAITPREVVITPRAGLSKVYGADDPVYKEGSWLSKDETSPLHQNVSGLPGYAVPVNIVEGKTTLTVSNAAYILAEAKQKGKMFFPGWLTREKGEAAGKYRILIGGMDFGSNFTTTVAEEYFTITQRPLLDDNVSLDDIPDKTYTGNAKEPKPVVRLFGNKLKAGVDYTVTYANNKNVGKAVVTVTGKGNFNGKRKITFNIVPKKTAISKLTTPAAGQITVTWKKGSNITGYQVAYSLDKAFSDQTLKTVKGSGKTSLTLKNLNSRKTYYVRVRTYKTVSGKKYYSAWSASKYVKTK